MKKLLLLTLISGASLFAQVQLGKNVQIGGQGSGAVGNGTAGQVAQYPSSGTSVSGATLSKDCTVSVGGAITCLTSDGKPIATLLPRVNGCNFRYQITDSTGTTVPDTCPDTAGSPNNGTLPAVAPTIGSFGALFLEPILNDPPASISTPIKTYQTLIFSFCTWPRGQMLDINTTTSGVGTDSNPGNLVAVIWGAGGSDGVWVEASGYNNVGQNQASNTPYLGDAGTANSSVVAGQYGGCHVEAAVLDSTTDSIYMDGVKLPLVVSTGSSSRATTASTYTIGAPTTLAPVAGWRGWINYIEGYPIQLTDAQIESESKNIQSIVSGRPGYPIIPAYNTGSRTNTIIFEGDSLMAGFQGLTPWTAAPYFAPTNTYNLLNYGLAGQTAHDIAALFPQQLAGAIVPAARTILMMDGATNDMTYSYSAQDTINAVAQAVKEAQLSGVLTTETSYLSRTGEDAYKNEFNPLLINRWRQMGMSAINDAAERPELGADGAYANTNCFNVDKVHLTGPGSTPVCLTGNQGDQSGYSVLAQTHAETVNYLDGSTFAKPTIPGSYPFQMTYGTVVVNTTCASGTCAVILPGCDHMDDMPFYVMNYGNAGTVTVGPPSDSFYQTTGYLLNGSSSAITLDPDTTTKFNELRGSMAAGGCQWVRESANSVGGSMVYPGSGIPISTGSAWGASLTAPTGVLTGTIASGTSSLGTSAIASGACATVVTTAGAGILATDAIIWNPNGSIKAVTGYVPATAGGLSIAAYPTSGNVNFDVCNWTAGSITPGAVTLNWRVVR